MVSVAGADVTDPREQWEMATPKTVQELRTLSKKEVANQIAALDRIAVGISPEIVIERYVKGDYLLQTLDYWAIAEGRAIWISKTVEPKFEEEVFAPMVDAFRRGVEECGKAVKDAEGARKTVAGSEPNNARELGSIAKDDQRGQHLFYAFGVALPAKLANRPDLVAKVSRILPLTRYIEGVLEPYGSIDEFMDDKANIEASLRLNRYDAEGRSLSLPPRPTATKPLVSEQTRQRIQILFEKYMAALTAKDAEAMVPLFADPEQGKIVASQLNRASIRNVDLSKARLTFEPRPDGTWDVTADYLWMDIQKKQREWKRVDASINMVVVEKETVVRLVSAGGKK